MNREEILSKSQQENRGQDVAGGEAFKSGAQLAWIVTVCLAAAVCIADALIFGRACYELLFVICAGEAIVFAHKYRAFRLRHELLVAACYGVGAAAFLLAWVMQIVNR